MADLLFGIPYAHHTASHLELILTRSGIEPHRGLSKRDLFAHVQSLELSLQEEEHRIIQLLLEDVVLQRQNLRREEEQLELALVRISVANGRGYQEVDHHDEDVDNTRSSRSQGANDLQEVGDMDVDRLGDMARAALEEMQQVNWQVRNALGETGWPASPTESVESEVRTCQACLEELNISSFPSRNITVTCDHEADICLVDLQEHIRTQLQDTPVTRLTCPSCEERLSNDDVQLWATPEIFDE
ncbi:hypothetical protein EG329_001199 [Mollisiaceae sp. DMI_Dod_QoI]|nr:hypothetical protein EG329_001199 [Helotiales sp. DMI_Dod_QoI]